MPSTEPSVSSEPALPEAAHDHEHHEHEHSHEDGEASGVLKTKTGCQDGCANCLACTRRTKAGE